MHPKNSWARVKIINRIPVSGEIPMRAVLFVCLGNICRSPCAEGAFRAKAAALGREADFIADSAGIQGYHAGEPPDHRAIETARRRGYSISGQRARRVRAQDFHEFDLILGLDLSHYEALKRLAPEGAKARIGLLMEYAQQTGTREVPDPYYGGMADFEHAMDLIEEGVEGVLAYLVNNMKNSE